MSLAQIGWDHALTVSDRDPDLIVAGGTGPVFSRDGGKSWAFGPEGESVHSDIQDAVLRGDRLWIVSDGGLNRIELGGGVYQGCQPGLWFRNDDMDSWVRYDKGLPYTRVSFLQIDYAAGLIRAGTNQGGWQAPLAQDFAPHAVIAASHQSVTPATQKVKGKGSRLSP